MSCAMSYSARASHGCQRHGASPQAFAQHQDVWLDAVVLDGKELPSAAQGDGDFVEDQQRTMAIANGSQLLVIRQRWNLDIRAA